MTTADENPAEVPVPEDRPASRLRAAASHLGQARDHLSSGVKEARADFSGGVGQAREHLSSGLKEARADFASGAGQARDHITVGMADAMSASRDAAREAKAELDDKFEKLLGQSKDLFAQAEDLIRSRPWTTFGAAFAAGYLIARLSRRN